MMIMNVLRRKFSLWSSVFFLLFSFSSCNNQKESAAKADNSPNRPAVNVKADQTPLKPSLSADDTRNELPPAKKHTEIVDSTLIHIKRTPCFGKCPTYHFTVYESGYAIYEGKYFVEMEGTYQAWVTKKQLDTVYEVAEKIGYFELEHEYDNPGISDLPAVHTAVNKKNKSQHVINRYNGPEKLRELEKAIDRIIPQLTWEKVSDYNNR